MSKSRQKKTKKASTPSSLDNSSLSTGDSSQLYEPVLGNYSTTSIILLPTSDKEIVASYLSIKVTKQSQKAIETVR